MAEAPTRYGKRVSFSLTPPEGRTAPEILQHRLSYFTTNYFTPNNLIGPLQEGLEQRATFSEMLGKPMANLMKSAGREAAREIALRTMRVEEVLDNVLPAKLRDSVYYSLLDRIDLGKLRDPFNPREGVPGLERDEPGRFLRHAYLQFHPFTTNPSIEGTFHCSAIDMGVRAGRKEAALVAEIPLGASWVFTQGIKCEHYDPKMTYMLLELSRPMKNGYFTAGVRLPVLRNAAEENHLQIIVGFQIRI